MPNPEIEDDESVTLTTQIGRFKARWQDHHSREPNFPPLRILKCLGLQYADIPYRWAAPRERILPRPGVEDCTKFGPGCPQAPQPLFDIDSIPLFGRLGPGGFPIRAETEDEFACLNLNIFAPLDAVGDTAVTGIAEKRLPVLVWVHGGAYVVGAGGVELYDASELVARSVRIGSPLIVVTFNYRLGVLGHLHSRELAADAALQKDLPEHFRSTANLGLLDSFRAFEWVKKNIHCFGGDPGNITGIGESAGAAILSYHSLVRNLHVNIPRMILSSSSIFSNQLLRASEAQSWFEAICDKNGLRAGAVDCISALRKVPLQSLITKSTFAYSAFRPIWDDVTITYDPRRVVEDPSLWDDALEQIVFGHCENESWMRLGCLPKGRLNIQASIDGRIPPTGDLRERAGQLYGEGSKYEWYGPSDENLSAEAQRWMALEGHARYYAVTSLLSDSFLSRKPSPSGRERTIRKYIFSWNTQHWLSLWQVTHTADILPMFLHPSLLPQDVAVARTFADNLIALAANKTGQVEWRVHQLDDKCFNVLDSRGCWGISMEGDGEFGLTPEVLDLWQDVVGASLKAGREGWVGMSR